MFECEKCLHEEMCDQPSRHLWATMAGEKDCTDFKGKADFVEVVRCKDCRHWRDDILRDDGEMKCCPIGMYMTKGDDFCSFGKRREGE